MEAKVIYGAIDNIVPYSVGINYIELLRVVDSRGDSVVPDKVLGTLERLLGTITVTSDVVNYEGDNLPSVRFYVSSKASSWKFTHKEEIDQEQMKAHLNLIVKSWNGSEEAKKLKSEGLSAEEAERLAKKMAQKIGSQLISVLYRQSGNTTVSPETAKGVKFESEEGNMFILDAGFNDIIERQMDIINSATRIDNEFSQYIARDVLGLTIRRIGLDYITRFEGDAEEYLHTKSSKFDRKSHTPMARYPKGVMEQEVEKVLIQLQALYERGETLGGIRQEKVLNYINGVAYNINRFRSAMRSGASYVDLVKAFAKFHHIIAESVVNNRFRRI